MHIHLKERWQAQLEVFVDGNLLRDWVEACEEGGWAVYRQATNRKAWFVPFQGHIEIRLPHKASSGLMRLYKAAKRSSHTSCLIPKRADLGEVYRIPDEVVIYASE